MDIDIHVMVVPVHSWRKDLNYAYLFSCEESWSLGVIRVNANITLLQLRVVMRHQLDLYLLPRHFMYLFNTGRCLSKITPRQEKILKVNFYSKSKQPSVHEVYIIDKACLHMQQPIPTNNNAGGNYSSKLSTTEEDSCTSSSLPSSSIDEGGGATSILSSEGVSIASGGVSLSSDDVSPYAPPTSHLYHTSSNGRDSVPIEHKRVVPLNTYIARDQYLSRDLIGGVVSSDPRGSGGERHFGTAMGSSGPLDDHSRSHLQPQFHSKPHSESQQVLPQLQPRSRHQFESHSHPYIQPHSQPYIQPHSQPYIQPHSQPITQSHSQSQPHSQPITQPGQPHSQHPQFYTPTQFQPSFQTPSHPQSHSNLQFHSDSHSDPQSNSQLQNNSATPYYNSPSLQTNTLPQPHSVIHPSQSHQQSTHYSQYNATAVHKKQTTVALSGGKGSNIAVNLSLDSPEVLATTANLRKSLFGDCKDNNTINYQSCDEVVSIVADPSSSSDSVVLTDNNAINSVIVAPPSKSYKEGENNTTLGQKLQSNNSGAITNTVGGQSFQRHCSQDNNSGGRGERNTTISLNLQSHIANNTGTITDIKDQQSLQHDNNGSSIDHGVSVSSHTANNGVLPVTTNTVPNTATLLLPPSIEDNFETRAVPLVKATMNTESERNKKIHHNKQTTVVMDTIHTNQPIAIEPGKLPGNGQINNSSYNKQNVAKSKADIITEIETIRTQCESITEDRALLLKELRQSQLVLKGETDKGDVFWKSKYHHEKLRTTQLEDNIRLVRKTIDLLMATTVGTVTRGSVKYRDAPSKMTNLRNQCWRYQHDMHQLEKQLVKTQKKLAVESETRESLTTKVQLTRKQLIEKRIEYGRNVTNHI